MLLAAVIPNLLPVIILLGIMGFAGISLKASTVIVISLCFGIAFDDTIHFLARMKIEIGKGALARLTIRQLLTRTLVECGEGIVLTSAAMCCGFLLLIFSEFNGTFYVGLFSSLTLIIAVLSELFLHPVLQEFLLRKNRANELK
jgi:predicted RND superfamily exporter protein